MRLRPAQVELAQANAFVAKLHRHHDPVTGHRYSIGAQLNGELVGVAIVGRPVGMFNPRSVVEVLRCCTDGTGNACSFLYGQCARVAEALGYERIVTYTRVDENGASLRAVGWEPQVLPLRSDYSFSSKNRVRAYTRGKDSVQKVRWTRWLNKA